MKIAFYDTKPYDKVWFAPLAEKAGAEIKFLQSRLSEETAFLARGADAVCCFVNDEVRDQVIDTLVGQGVRGVLLRCSGYDKVDLRAAAGKIRVFRVPAYSPTAVAEYAAALMLAVNRKVHKAYFRTREFNFSINGLMGVGLHGKKAGVIGLGRIGAVMVNILKGFGMDVMVYDPYAKKSRGIKCVSLDELLRESDVITLHCPLNSETRYVINKNSISRMKDGVILINTSRGALVDTTALLDALACKKFGGVALDVYEEEEDYFFEDKSGDIINDDELIKLMAYPNVLISSHQAFFTEEAMRAIAETTLENMKALMEDRETENEIKTAETVAAT